MRWDPTINLGQILVLAGFLAAFVKLFLSMRDTLRDLTIETRQTNKTVEDHEERIRVIEGRPVHFHSRRSDDAPRLAIATE